MSKRIVIPTPVELFHQMVEAQLTTMAVAQDEWAAMTRMSTEVMNANIEASMQIFRNTWNHNTALALEWNRIGRESVKRTVERMSPAPAAEA